MRTILHSDLNNFYASVECLLHPEIRDKCVVVAGSTEERHGIVLAKNIKAKQAGITTGMVNWQAKMLCPDLILLTPHFGDYLYFSRKVKAIYADYTDKIESFGIDECWLDVTDSLRLFGSGEDIANEIRNRVKKEIGLTVSVGVSFSKVYAKLGSDMKKPDAVTVISKENYKQLIYSLPASDMLGVGKSTNASLSKIGIKTIGDIANTKEQVLVNMFGKVGRVLYLSAIGEDVSPVCNFANDNFVKSVGNSITCYKDLDNEQEIKATLIIIAESVATRLRDLEIGYATVLTLWIKYEDLTSFSRQKTIMASNLSIDFANCAFELLLANIDRRHKIRALGISVSNFTTSVQTQIEYDECKHSRLLVAEKTVEKLRKRYGRTTMQKALVLKDTKIGQINLIDDHVIAGK